MEDKIQTLNPNPGKKGKRIARDKYDTLRTAILAALEEREPQEFYELLHSTEAGLEGRFEGSVSWYYVTVKLDMEARGEIERIPGTSPQQIRRVVRT